MFTFLTRFYGFGYAYCVTRKLILMRDAKVVETVKVVDLDTGHVSYYGDAFAYVNWYDAKMKKAI